MNDILKQIIKREVDKLPKDGQEAVNSLDWVQIIEEIGQRYLLDESEIEDLLTQTLLVLVGVRDADLYATAVENKVWTNNKEKAKKIAEEVFQKIFIPIGNIIIENIKKSGKHKDANAGQNLDFILSGGDYSAFMMPVSNSPLEEYSALKAEGGGSISPPPSGEEGRGFPKTDKPFEERGNTPRKMDDLRSKFTI